MSKEINQSSKIYNSPDNKRLPNYYDRDIVKILVRNPIEAFAFWGISSKTFQNVQSLLKTAMEEVFLKLHIKFFDEHSHFRENIITLPPFTDNWLMRFESPPHNLQVEIVALNSHGNYHSILTSAQVTLPKNRPSIHVDKIWVSPKWIADGAVTETQSGDWVLSKPTGLQNSVPATGKFVGVFTGSSGHLGSSEKFAGSSEKFQGSSEKFVGSSEQVAGLSGQTVTGGSSEQMLSEQYLGSSEQSLSEQYLGSSEQSLSEQYLGSSEQSLSEQYLGSSEQMLSEQYLGSSESYMVTEEFAGSSGSYWLSEEFQGSSGNFLGSSGGFVVSGNFLGSSEHFGSSGNFMGSSEHFGSSDNFMGSSEHFGSSGNFMGSSELLQEDDDKKVLKG
jgi:hypothetical protein